MNVIKNKIFGYAKFHDNEEVPRLTFNSKFIRSAYQDCNKLHPALEALLHFIYTEGRIDPARPIQFEDEEAFLVSALLVKLKEGHWKCLDERVFTPCIAMAALCEYLKSLPKSLWSSVRTEDWKILCESFHDGTKDAMEEALKNFILQAQNILRYMKPPVRHFSAKLLMTLNEVMSRSEEDLRAAAALRLSEYFTPALVTDCYITDGQTSLLQGTIAVMIEEAPSIFRSQEVPTDIPLSTSKH